MNNGNTPLVETAMRDLLIEFNKQIEKWGIQNHPYGTGGADAINARDVSRMECARAFRNGYGTWRDILDEEVSEAFAEIDPLKLRTELVQVAAVAVSWIVDIDSRNTVTTELPTFV